MKTTHVLIASVLKPIDEPRMFEKLAVSIYKEKGFSVKVVGMHGKIMTSSPVKQVALYRFRRGQIFKRLWAPWQFFTFLLKERPNILIVCTHELLVPAAFYKMLFGVKFLYDIQENYALTLRFAPYHTPLKAFLSYLLLRFRESVGKSMADRLILAERVYEKQLKPKKPFDILENKSVALENSPTQPPTLLFSGTIAETTGIFEAIAAFKCIKKVEPDWQLHICGFCPLPHIWEKVLSATRNISGVKITGGDHPVPYTEVKAAISAATAAVVHYTPLPSVEGKIPTKLYEYLSAKLQILLVDFASAEAMVANYQPVVHLSRKALFEGTANLTPFFEALRAPRINGPELTWERQWEQSDFRKALLTFREKIN